MNNDDFFQQTRAQAMRSWILTQMMTGAGWAALVFFGTMLVIWVIYLLGLLLPEDSRLTPDPMPRSSIEQPLDAHRATV